ncbi:MAG TPA: tetratricopeptide repeat protein, partial [Polyangia bacterium]|nr:tetratricopeptide repeat protein [Polyangia bacterium]
MLRLWVALALAIAVNPAYAAPKKKKPGIVKRVVAHLKAPPSEKSPAPTAAVERLGRGYKAYVDGQYELAKKELRGIDPKQMQNADYVLYLLAQSELLTGEPKPAREHFHELTLMPSRFATVAKWRVADCDWDAGDFETARKGYEAVLPSANENIVEAAVARFRIGEALAKKGALPAAQHEWRKVYVGEPMHPLAETALARLVDTKAPPITPEERIARAKVMTANRAWPKALEELALVPDGVPQAVRDEADYWFGTTKFKMRRDYDVAAQKLLGVWQRLPGDDRKVDALFHGSRAWSRADKDDEAQKGYRELLQKYPRSKASPEASFLIGWLDFNRGRYPQAIPALEETLRRYGSTRFQDDARWCLGFSRWLSGDTAGALADFQKLAAFPGALSGGKGAYWAARALDKLGRSAEAIAAWRKLVSMYPFSYYATQARARLKEKGIAVGPFGGTSRGSAPPLGPVDEKLASDPIISGVDELLRAGLDVEAG